MQQEVRRIFKIALKIWLNEIKAKIQSRILGFYLRILWTWAEFYKFVENIFLKMKLCTLIDHVSGTFPKF